MPRLVLHIGLEKTGSTAIQYFLSSNRSFLEGRGFYFPRSPGEFNHLKLAILAHDNERKKNLARMLGLADRTSLDAFIRKFKADFRKEVARRRDTVILSNEHCSSRLTSRQEVLQLYRFLGEFDPEPRVVVYLRRQDDFLESSYSTAVKAGRTQPFSVPPEGASRHRYDYWHILSIWSQVFGQSNIIVRVYDEAVADGRSVVWDFADALQLGDLKGTIADERRNPRMSATSLEFLRQMNCFLPDPFSNRRMEARRGRLVKILEKHSEEEGPLLTDEERVSFLARFDHSNHQVAKVFLNREDGRLFPPLGAQARPAAMPLTMEKCIELAAAVWMEMPRS